MRAIKTVDFAQYCRCSGLEGLEVMSARWMEHSFAPHMHDFYAVSLNYGGRGAFRCRGEVRDAMPGSCNLIAPGEMHTGHATSDEGWINRNLYIETSLMEMLCADSTGKARWTFGSSHRWSRTQSWPRGWRKRSQF